MQLVSPTSKTSPASAPPKKRWRTLSRLLISLALLYLVYSSIDVQQLLATLSRVSISTAVVFACLYAIGQFMSALKWRILCTEVSLHRSLPEVFTAYFLGMFVNSFALGTVGGDVTRSLALKPQSGQRAAALATVVADRAHGLAVLAAIGAVAILIEKPPVLGSLGSIAAAGIVLAVIAAWLLGPRVLVRIFPESHRFGAAAKQVALAFPRSRLTVLKVSAISVLFHSLQIGMHALLAYELGAGLTLMYLFATVPLVNIASSLPLSINGLGIRETMYVLLFVPMGVPQETAVAFGAIWIVAVTAVSAVGGLIAANVRNKSKDSDSGEPEPIPVSTYSTHSEEPKRASRF